MHIYLFAVLIGAVAALLGALLGVGGGILMVPAFVKLGLPMKNAISTSLAVMVVTSAVSTGRYAKQGWVDWRIAACAAAAAMVAAYFGTELMKRLSSGELRMAFGSFLILVGVYMLVVGRGSA